MLSQVIEEESWVSLLNDDPERLARLQPPLRDAGMRRADLSS